MNIRDFHPPKRRKNENFYGTEFKQKALKPDVARPAMGLLKEIKPFCSKQSTQILFSASISNHSLLPSLLSLNSTSIGFSCENNHSKNFAFINLHRFPSDYWCCLTRVSRIIGSAPCRLNSSQIQDIYDEAD